MTDARFQDEIMSRLPLDMGDSDVLMIAGAFGWSSEFMAKATSKRSLAKAAVKSSGHIGNLLAKAAPPPPKALATTMSTQEKERGTKRKKEKKRGKKRKKEKKKQCPPN